MDTTPHHPPQGQGQSMKAWQVQRHGDPVDVLALVETDLPTPGPDQVVVRVRATAANFPDVLLCRGEYQIDPELPFTPGAEMCGEVVAVGSQVTDVSVGQRVIGMAALPHGGFAEYALLDAVSTFPAPDSLDDAEASAMLIAYQTAWFALHRRAAIRQGDTLLVHAAAGGVGSAAVQLGKAAGAVVIGVANGEQKTQVVRELGADLVVDRSTEDFVPVVKDFTDGRGVDVIFDPVGGETYQRSTKVVAFEGRIVVIGFAGGEIQKAALNHALVKNYSILGLHWGLYNTVDPQLVHDAHRELTELAGSGFRPLIGERIDLDDVPAALGRLASGDTVGRTVMIPTTEGADE